MYVFLVDIFDQLWLWLSVLVQGMDSKLFKGADCLYLWQLNAW